MPLFSVIIPLFNKEAFIENTLKSIFNQSFSDYEIIIVNDASTDKSEEIVLQFNDTRIKYFYKKNDVLIVTVFATLLGGCLWMFLALEIFDVPLQWEKLQGDLIFYMAYLVIGTTVITVYLYQKASIIIGPKKLMAYVYLNPAMVAVLMYIFEGKLITSWIFVGILISTFATIVLLKQK